MNERRFQIGVFGSADGDEIGKCIEKAEAIGDEIAEHGCVLITGACPGLPHRTALAVANRNGRIIGISPAMNPREHIEKYKYPSDWLYQLVFTGMERKGRNIISLRAMRLFLSADESERLMNLRSLMMRRQKVL